jgi:hypothetical protein
MKAQTIKDGTFGPITYILNGLGKVTMRLRENLWDNTETIIREYDPAVSLEDAQSHSRNYKIRKHVTSDEAKALIKKLTGGKKSVKKATIVKTIGPYGTIRYRDVKTGLFVAKK